MKCTLNKPLAAEIKKFNKKNATWFADQIYSENKDGVQFLKLCCDALRDRDAKKVHCAVGEAYSVFVKSTLRGVLKKANYSSQWTTNADGPTAAAIDALVEKAELVDDSDIGREDLAHALSDCVSANDNTHGYDVDSDINYPT